MSTISINAALATIDQAYIDGEPFVFSITYFKKDGTRGHIARATKKKPGSPGITAAQAKPTRQFNHSIKEAGTLLLWNLDKGAQREIIIDLITSFNGLKIYHQ